jgi:hypothetical protein
MIVTLLAAQLGSIAGGLGNQLAEARPPRDLTTVPIL